MGNKQGGIENLLKKYWHFSMKYAVGVKNKYYDKFDYDKQYKNRKGNTFTKTVPKEKEKLENKLKNEITVFFKNKNKDQKIEYIEKLIVAEDDIEKELRESNSSIPFFYWTSEEKNNLKQDKEIYLPLIWESGKGRVVDISPFQFAAKRKFIKTILQKEAPEALNQVLDKEQAVLQEEHNKKITQNGSNVPTDKHSAQAPDYDSNDETEELRDMMRGDDDFNLKF